MSMLCGDPYSGIGCSEPDCTHGWESGPAQPLRKNIIDILYDYCGGELGEDRAAELLFSTVSPVVERDLLTNLMAKYNHAYEREMYDPSARIGLLTAAKLMEAELQHMKEGNDG